MSGIKFKGDTSGEILLETPAVAGTNTLTLPAETGTLATTTEVNNVVDNHLGMRNLIINGNMQIAQRATSKTSITADGFYTCDRWEALVRTAGTWTQTQDTGVANEGFAKSLKMDCTTADASLGASDRIFMYQRIEGFNTQSIKKGTANAESVTLSFWIKSNKTGTYIAELQDLDNSRDISQAYTISSANTWEKKTLTFVPDTTGALDNDNAGSLDVYFWLAAGSDFSSGTLNTSWNSTVSANRAVGQVNLADSTSNYVNITGVQLEVGTTATPFENVPYDLNLQRCFRYYQHFKGGSAFTSGVNGVYNDTTTLVGLHTHIVPMRAAPTFSYSNIAHFDLEPFDAQPTTLTSNSGGNLYQASVTAKDPTARVRGYGGIITCDNAAGFFAFSAEL